METNDTHWQIKVILNNKHQDYEWNKYQSNLIESILQGLVLTVWLNIRSHPTVFPTFERVYDHFVNSRCCRIKGILI